MIAELVYLPTILLLGLGLLLLDSGGSSSDDDDATTDEGEGTLGVGDDGVGEDLDPPTPNGSSLEELTDDADTFEGDEDDNTIFAEDGDDTVSGGAGDDRVFLNEGDDVSDADSGDMAGDDLIRGGDGADTITDNLGANTIFGDLGADKIDTTDAGDESTPDIVNAGFGNDMIFADDGDTVTGGGGNDLFTVAFTTGSENPVTITDFEDGERLIVEVIQTEDEATDDASIVIADNETDTEIQLEGQTIAIIQGFTDLDALNIQFVTKVINDDEGIEIDASDAAQTLAGTPNADTIFTGAGDDTVNAGDGDDTIVANAPFDENVSNNNLINAGLGDDIVEGGFGDDVINGSLGADALVGGGGSDTISGGFGADELDGVTNDGTDSPDVLFGGAGADVLIGNDGDIMTGGEWRDTFVSFNFTEGDDVMTITDFDIEDDKIEITEDGEVTFVAANDGADTSVLLDGQPVFLLTGVTPAQMADATVTAGSG